MAQPNTAGLSPSDWVTIGLFVAAGLAAIIWWVVQRFVRRVDGVYDDVYGDEGSLKRLELQLDGMRRGLAEYIHREDFDVEISQIEGHLKLLRTESQDRETRLLLQLSKIDRTLEKLDTHARDDSRRFNEMVVSIHKRVDGLVDRYERSTGRRSSRPS